MEQKGITHMALYEHVFLTRQDATQQQVDALVDQAKNIVTAAGGKITKTEYWGVKSVAFRIKKNRKAHYSLLNIDAPAAAINELERQESISEDVIRYMTVKVEALEDGPSAQMRRREDREERGGFDDRGFGGGFGGSPGRGGGRARREEQASEEN